MGAALPALLAALAGALLAAQGPINAALARALGSPVAATVVSFAVGAGAAALVFGLTAAPVAWRAAPGWLYLVGGLLGAVIVLAGATLTPRLGAAAFLACLVSGQLAAGLALDHVGALGLPTHPASLLRIGATALVVTGAALLVVF